MEYKCKLIVSRTLLAILIFILNRALTAQTIVLSSETIAVISQRKSAQISAHGRAASVTPDALSALIFNPALLYDLEGFKTEAHAGSFQDSLILYQNIFGLKSQYGNFSIGYSIWDSSRNLFQFNQLYDIIGSYSFGIIPGVYTGVSFISNPFGESLSLGLAAPFKTGIKIWNAIGIYEILYGASIQNISFSNQIPDNLPLNLTNSLRFTLINVDKFKLQNVYELTLSSDILKRKFHVGLSVEFLNFFILGMGMYGNNVMTLTETSYGSGIILKRGYSNIQIYFARDTENESVNNSVSLLFAMQFDGQKSHSVQGMIRNRHISPFNQDGKFDSAELKLYSEKIEMLESWSLEIRNEAGWLVRSIKPLENEIKAKKIPSTIEWSGRDDWNNYVEDGNYRIRFIYKTKNKDTYHFDFPVVTIDNIPPRLVVSAESNEIIYKKNAENVFNLSFQLVDRKLSDTWNIRLISESGSTIKEWVMLSSEMPSNFSVALYDDYGKLLNPGKYTISILGHDQASNYSEPIEIPFKFYLMKERATVRAGLRSFSPVYRDMPVFLSTSGSDRIMKWETIIKNGNNQVVFTRTGYDQVPESLLWSGKTDNNEILEDGLYFIQLFISYENQKVIASEVEEVEIDTKPPVLRIDNFPDNFNPDYNNDGQHITFNLEISEEKKVKSWQLSIYESSMPVFRSYFGKGFPPQMIKWNGNGDSGRLVKSFSEYYYTYSAVDLAGNVSTFKAGPITTGLISFKIDNEIRLKTFSIYFDISEEVPQKSEMKKLKKIIDLMQGELNGYHLVLEGHTDIYGEENFNDKLASKRANWVKNYLTDKFPQSKTMIEIESYGKRNPVTERHELQAINRRVELFFYLKDAPGKAGVH